MPTEKRNSQSIDKQLGSYAPGWLKKSRDDVPDTDQDLPENPLVEAIMSNGNTTNEQAGEQQQSGTAQTQSESDR